VPDPSVSLCILNEKIVPQPRDWRRCEVPERVGINNPIPRREVENFERHRGYHQNHTPQRLGDPLLRVGARCEGEALERRGRNTKQNPQDVVDHSDHEVGQDVVTVIKTWRKGQV